jgi:carbon storage regulator CsrA
MTRNDPGPCADGAHGPAPPTPSTPISPIPGPGRRTHLVITRGEGESIFIGDDVEIVVHSITHGQGVRIGIKSPRDKLIMRSEVASKQAAEQATGGDL